MAPGAVFEVLHGEASAYSCLSAWTCGEDDEFLCTHTDYILFCGTFDS